MYRLATAAPVLYCRFSCKKRNASGVKSLLFCYVFRNNLSAFYVHPLYSYKNETISLVFTGSILPDGNGSKTIICFYDTVDQLTKYGFCHFGAEYKYLC